MKANLGDADRAIRIIGGIILVAIGAFTNLTAASAVLLIVIGAYAIISGWLKYCVIYDLLGISTAKVPKKAE